jgi:NTE family protein
MIFMTQKRLSVFFICLFILMNSPIFSNQRPKIGLVLDGGGALGLAHIGVLKMLDKNQIPVDFVVGTSMGGIVGALYSMGYTGDEIQKMAESLDWKYFFSDNPQRSVQPFFQKRLSGKYQIDLEAKSMIPVPPSGLIYGQKISLYFSSLAIPYEHLSHFDELPIPFRCVAVDLISGKEIVLKSGSLSMAMRSTMSIPSVFSPVKWDDYLLIDGGILNNLPVDVAKQMGADIVIAVVIEKSLLKREEINSAFHVLRQSIKIVELHQSSSQVKQADFIISPRLTNYNMFDFFFRDKLKGIIEAGNKAAEKSWPVLKEMFEKWNVLDSDFLDIKKNSVDNPIIHSLQVRGLKTIPYHEIKERLGIKKGETFESNDLKKKLNFIKQDLNLKNIDYKIIPVSSKEAKMVLTIEETGEPIIKRVSIKGNKYLPASFIKRLLGSKKDIRFQEKKITDKIMKIYSLGYFTNIRYEIIYLGKNEVQLNLFVNESRKNSFHAGIRYDNRHKIISLAAFNANNFLVPGLRSENEFQFIGLTRFDSSLYYPTRSFNVPIYPYLSLKYRDIPTQLFDGMGNIQLEFKNCGLDIGFGLGFLFLNLINSEVGFYQEFMNLNGAASEAEKMYFPDLKDGLRKICASFTIDTLNDTLLPYRGIYLKAFYEGSFKKLGSDKKYQLLGISTDLYNTYRNHTLRLYGFLGFSSDSLPLYKYFNKGSPSTFIGMGYDQVFVNEIKILRMDYQYNLSDIIHFKFMSNLAFDVEKRFPEKIYSPDILWGTGVGIMLYSPLGTAEIIYSVGSHSFKFPKKTQDVLYLTLGTKF